MTVRHRVVAHDRPPHGGQPVLEAGAPVDLAAAAVILVHGRHASPRNIVELADRFDRADVAYLAPAAAGGTWYPQSFLAPIADNEPGLSSGIAVLASLVDELAASGVSADRVVIAGFSQGACLTSEFAARHARRFGGLVVFTGGVAGPEGTPRDYAGRFDGTPVFLGASDVDAHVPRARVEETAALFRRMGAQVDLRIYPAMGHLVNDDEIAHAQRVVDLARQQSRG
jgi:predicted esterase